MLHIIILIEGNKNKIHTLFIATPGGMSVVYRIYTGRGIALYSVELYMYLQIPEVNSACHISLGCSSPTFLPVRRAPTNTTDDPNFSHKF